MNVTAAHYGKLAGLFSYPDADFGEKVRDVQAFLDGVSSGAAEELKSFAEFAARASLFEQEEIYTRSFDVQAITTLDVGYVLFGDDYKRGELLVNLNREHQEAGVDCGTELSDHLPNVLRLLDAMEKPELRAELVKRVVGPALRKIIGEFDPARLESKNAVYQKHHKTLIESSESYGLIYAKPLRALYVLLQENFDVGTDEEKVVPHHSQFLNSIGTEMKLEPDKGDCHGAPR